MSSAHVSPRTSSNAERVPASSASERVAIRNAGYGVGWSSRRWKVLLVISGDVVKRFYKKMLVVFSVSASTAPANVPTTTN